MTDRPPDHVTLTYQSKLPILYLPMLFLKERERDMCIEQ
jgi:hypothetical protein